MCAPFFHHPFHHPKSVLVVVIAISLSRLADSTVSSFFSLLQLYLRVFRYHSLQIWYRMRHIKRALALVLYIAAHISVCARSYLPRTRTPSHLLSVIFFVKFFIFRAYSCLPLLLHLHADLPYIFIKE